MGQKGDWKKEGYNIKPIRSYDEISDSNDWTILMISPEKERAAELRIYVDRKRNYLRVSSVYVKEDHRRKGIASALYDYAEQIIGKKIKPANEVSNDAEIFWKSRS